MQVRDNQKDDILTLELSHVTIDHVEGGASMIRCTAED
jgi:hypothetical protein